VTIFTIQDATPNMTELVISALNGIVIWTYFLFDLINEIPAYLLCQLVTVKHGVYKGRIFTISLGRSTTGFQATPDLS